jgi:transposase
VNEGCFAGVDWASEEHACCVVDGDGRIVEGRRFRHDERGLRALCNRLIELGVLLVAVERPDGLLIERLLDAGLHVIAVHPNQVVAMRPRFSASGGKTDSFDSFVLAEPARTDAHRFRVLVPDGDATKALRALTRAREDLVDTRVALANELRAQLECFWPGAVAIFAEIDSPITLAFPKRYPSPADAHGLGEQRPQRFLARHHYCGRRPAAELLSRLRGAANGRADMLESQARCQIVLAFVAALEPIVTRIAELTSEIRAGLHDHPDGEIFRSLFRDPRPPSAPPACSPRSATAAPATPPRTRLPATAANPRSPSNPASPNEPDSAGPATTASETRSAPSPTPAATPTPGPPTSTAAHGHAAAPTSTPSASSAAPGAP